MGAVGSGHPLHDQGHPPPIMAKARDIEGLGPNTPYVEAAAATVAVRADELWEHSEGVLDTSDIERVHDMRVATRRLRAVLEIYEPCFDRAGFRSVLRDVKRLADALGERRDPDVELAALEELEAALPKPDAPGIELFAQLVRAEQEAGNATLEKALAEAEATDLRGRLTRLVESAREAA
jgi:CHAD domain-containing protein